MQKLTIIFRGNCVTFLKIIDQHNTFVTQKTVAITFAADGTVFAFFGALPKIRETVNEDIPSTGIFNLVKGAKGLDTLIVIVVDSILLCNVRGMIMNSHYYWPPISGFIVFALNELYLSDPSVAILC